MAGTWSVGRSHRYRASGNSISSLPTTLIVSAILLFLDAWSTTGHPTRTRADYPPSQYYPM